MISTDVLVVGGGPCGLMMAIELGRRGIRCLVVDSKPGTAVNPQANATPNRYSPTASPGGRPPHAWLVDRRSLVDMFHDEWTLLALGPDARSTASFEVAAPDLSLDMSVVRLADASLCDLYEARLVLIRPDQIVAWRGDSGDGAADVLAHATGRKPS